MQKDLLRVNDVKQFIDRGYDGVSDVYAGVFDDLTQPNFASRIAEWNYATNHMQSGTAIKLGYAVMDEFHNFHLEKYRRPQFGPINDLDFDGFEKVLFFSATAPAQLADNALEAIEFAGIEKPALCASEVLDADKRCLLGIRGCYTPMVDLVTKVPLGHVYKTLRRVSEPHKEAFKLLHALFRYDPKAKAVVLTKPRNMVQQLASEWEQDFKIVWIHGQLATSEKVRRAESFLRDGNVNVLVGTKLATEGIDVRELRMVIMIDHLPTIIEFLQAGGRLRSIGMLHVLLDVNNSCIRNNSDSTPMELSCPVAQISQFYGFGMSSTEAQHRACCGQTDSLSDATKRLVSSVTKAAEQMEYETEKQKQSRLSNTKRKAPDNPAVKLMKDRLYKRVHGSGHYTSIWNHLGFGRVLAENLAVNGINSHFWPTGKCSEEGYCEQCLKPSDLCVCSSATPSYAQFACEVLAVRRMVLDDEEYKEHIKDLRVKLPDLAHYIINFDDEKKTLFRAARKHSSWFEDLMESGLIVAAECLRGTEYSFVFALSGDQIERLYCEQWKSLRAQKTEALEFFWRWAKRESPAAWDKDWKKDRSSFASIIEKEGTFARLHEHGSANLHGPYYVQTQYYQHLDCKRRYEKWKKEKFDRYFQDSFHPPWDFFLSMVLGMFFNKRLKERSRFSSSRSRRCV